MDEVLVVIQKWLPLIGTAAFFYIVYLLAQKILDRQSKGKTDKALIKNIILFSVGLIGVISIILAIPMDHEQRGQITSLIGIVLSAVLGLSATSFIGNAIAGISLKLQRQFKLGDLITVGEHFGRITEQGLFHTEIQNVDRDLTTLPNLYLATNAYKITRSSGTFIKTEVSLGYDVNRKKVEEALLKAATNAGLKDAFVHIVRLQDYSVVYQVHGLLVDIKTIVSARSTLAGCVLDSLHEAKIEIVSPSFMNQRQVDDQQFIANRYESSRKKEESKPEKVIFDKAEEAESIENRKKRLEEMQARLKAEKDKLKSADKADKEKIEGQIQRLNDACDSLLNKIDVQVDELGKAD